MADRIWTPRPVYGPTCCWPECGAEAHEGTPLCGGHLVDAWKVVREAQQDEVLRFYEPHSPESIEYDERMAARRLAMDEQSVVYYVDAAPGLIKIGYTRNLKKRLADLRLPVTAVLATEPGGEPLERHRHQQFATLRVGRWEHFRTEPELLRHIDLIRQHYGDPSCPSAGGSRRPRGQEPPTPPPPAGR